MPSLPATEISRVLAANKVTVRKPEQGTAPKLFYVGGHDAAMHPTATPRTPETFMWADVLSPVGDGAPPRAEAATSAAKRAASGAALRTPGPQGVPTPGPIMIGEGRMADHMVQVGYNAQHRIPWHWPVPAYLVTKAVAAGLFMFLSLGYGLGLFGFDALAFLVAGLTVLVFTAVTTGLLVFDLERPERFLRILTRPQWQSWLVRGAFLLLGFSVVAGLWWLLEAGAYGGLWSTAAAGAVRPFLLWIGLPLAVGAAIYTAFLFGQAEGRDLWQSSLLPVHLLVQAFMAGAAALLVLAAFLHVPADLVRVARLTFGTAMGLDLLVTFLGEFGMSHASEAAAQAAHAIRHGRYRHHFWVWSFLTGHLIPLALLFVAEPLTAALAGVLSLVGLYYYEYAFVMAPQEVANS